MSTQPVNSENFREAAARFATGVTVITTVHEDRPAGMTASAVTSLSLDPVMLLVCISTHLQTHHAIDASRRFVVNVLGRGQEKLALQFARSGTDKFADVELSEEHELPVLNEAIAYFVCDVHERYPGGDHSIFTGLVRECRARPGLQPLLYYGSRFGAWHDPAFEEMRDALGWDMPSLSGLGVYKSVRQALELGCDKPA
jgi:3-hydroxy-9,10-secoandrosta-1,3,5(10)-triene-9,17-dione monooxygenase reductase component